jgi:hypothetical protein
VGAHEAPVLPATDASEDIGGIHPGWRLLNQASVVKAIFVQVGEGGKGKSGRRCHDRKTHLFNRNWLRSSNLAAQTIVGGADTTATPSPIEGHDRAIKSFFEAIRESMALPAKRGTATGFRAPS